MKRSSNSSLDTRKIRKILNEEVRLGINASSDSESEEVDLKKELFPLSHYMNEREEMIEQMFSIIKGEKLQKMLPPILKDMPLNELKADCLIHLLGMSTTRISAILEGREINSSSDSETHSDSSASPSKKTKKNFIPIPIKQEGCSDISDNSEEVVLIDPDKEDSVKGVGSKKKKNFFEENGKRKKKHKQKKKDLKQSKISRKVLQEDNKMKNEKSNKNEILPINSSDSEKEAVEESPKGGKTLLEILELEMRARAIRALLHKGDDPENAGVETPSISFKETIAPESNSLETKTNFITPAKNFRNNKDESKSDDVIVIAPELETIDLTEENNPSTAQENESQQNNLEAENIVNSIQLSVGEGGEKSNSLNEEENKLSGDGEVSSSETEEETVTEIIAIPDSPEKIKPQDNIESSKQAEDKLEEKPTNSWAQRWLESKEVKKVVSTSKIFGNVRKKIKKAKLDKQNHAKQNEELSKSAAEPPQIEGRVDEYKSLPKSNNTINSSSETVTTLTTANEKVQVEGNKDSSAQSSTQSQSTVAVSTNTELSGEQVQDVSSTKIEISIQKSELQEIYVYNTETNSTKNLRLKNNEIDMKEPITCCLKEKEEVDTNVSNINKEENAVTNLAGGLHSYSDLQEKTESNVKAIEDTDAVSEIGNLGSVIDTQVYKNHVIKAKEMIYSKYKSDMEKKKNTDVIVEENLVGVLKRVTGEQNSTYHVGKEYKVTDLKSVSNLSKHSDNLSEVGLNEKVYSTSENEIEHKDRISEVNKIVSLKYKRCIQEEQDKKYVNFSGVSKKVESTSENVLQEHMLCDSELASTSYSKSVSEQTVSATVSDHSSCQKSMEECTGYIGKDKEEGEEATFSLEVSKNIYITKEVKSNICESSNNHTTSKLESHAVLDTLPETIERQGFSSDSVHKVYTLNIKSSTDENEKNKTAQDLSVESKTSVIKNVGTESQSPNVVEPETLEINITDEELDIE